MILEALRARDREALTRAFTGEARVRLAGEDAWTVAEQAPLLLRRYRPTQVAGGVAEAADRLLAMVADWPLLAREEASLDRFWLDGDRATGRLELRLAGETADGEEDGGGSDCDTAGQSEA